jgi:hypothetical protein
MAGKSEFNPPGYAASVHPQVEWSVLPHCGCVPEPVLPATYLRDVKVLEDGFADVEGLGAAGAAGEFFEAFFDRFCEANSWHGYLAIRVLQQAPIGIGVPGTGGEGGDTRVARQNCVDKDRVRGYCRRTLVGAPGHKPLSQVTYTRANAVSSHPARSLRFERRGERPSKVLCRAACQRVQED